MPPLVAAKGDMLSISLGSRCRTHNTLQFVERSSRTEMVHGRLSSLSLSPLLPGWSWQRRSRYCELRSLPQPPRQMQRRTDGRTDQDCETPENPFDPQGVCEAVAASQGNGFHGSVGGDGDGHRRLRSLRFQYSIILKLIFIGFCCFVLSNPRARRARGLGNENGHSRRNSVLGGLGGFPPIIGHTCPPPLR